LRRHHLSTAARFLPLAFALVGVASTPSCTWGGYDGALATNDAGLGQACDGVLTNCGAPPGAGPDAGYTCVANKCREECLSDTDCAVGTRCLWVATANCGSGSCCNGMCSNGFPQGTAPGVAGFCLDNASVSCSPNGVAGSSSVACPGNTSCAPDGYCRNMCSAQNPCASPESCENVGNGGCMGGGTCGPQYCVAAPAHDSTADSGAAIDAPADAPQGLDPGAMSPGLVAADTAGAEYVSWISQGNSVDVAAAGLGVIPMTIEANGTGVSGLAASGGFLYWGEQGLGIFSCPEQSCGTSMHSLAPAQAPLRVAASGTWVAWIDGRSLTVEGCSVASGACSGNVQTFASAQQGMSDIAVDSSTVYWLGTGTGMGMGMGTGSSSASTGVGVFSCPLGTACAMSPSFVGSAPGAQSIAVSADGVYAAGPQGAFLCARTGACSSLSGGTGAAVPQLTADASGVYAATMLGPVFCKAPCAKSSTFVEIDSSGAAAVGIAVTGPHVYWSSVAGGIFFAPKPGGGSTLSLAFRSTTFLDGGNP
jgi:hypothetical protein